MLLVNQASANPPIVLEGSVLIDGAPAPVGTEIKAMCEGSVVGTTTVDNEGLYSDTRDNRLGISSECSTVTLLVNGIEAKVINLDDIDVGEIMVVDLQISPSSSSSSSTEKTTSSGGGGGYVAPPVEEETTDEIVDDTEQPVEEMAMSSTDDPVEEQETESEPVEDEELEEVQSADFPTMVGIGSMLMAFCVLIYRRAKD